MTIYIYIYIYIYAHTAPTHIYTHTHTHTHTHIYIYKIKNITLFTHKSVNSEQENNETKNFFNTRSYKTINYGWKNRQSKFAQVRW